MASIQTPNVLPPTTVQKAIAASPMITPIPNNQIPTVQMKEVTKTSEKHQFKEEKSIAPLYEKPEDQGSASGEVCFEINMPLPPEELPPVEEKQKKKWNIKRFQKVFKRSKKSVIAAEDE